MRPNGLTFNANGVANLPDGMRMLVWSGTLGANESYDLPAANGWGELVWDGFYYSKFMFTSSGIVRMYIAQGDIEVTDTGAASGNICIYDGGVSAQVLNRTGGNATLSLVAYYKAT